MSASSNSRMITRAAAILMRNTADNVIMNKQDTTNFVEEEIQRIDQEACDSRDCPFGAGQDPSNNRQDVNNPNPTGTSKNPYEHNRPPSRASTSSLAELIKEQANVIQELKRDRELLQQNQLDMERRLMDLERRLQRVVPNPTSGLADSQAISEVRSLPIGL
jgi:hypothetical protein